MGKIDVSYCQFEKALRQLGFAEKANGVEGIVFRHPETGFPILLPPGMPDDIVPPMYLEVAQRTVALCGIATEHHFAKALSAATDHSRHPHRRRPVNRPRTALATAE